MAICKLFTRPYCGRQLTWWVLQDGCDPNKAPDIVFQEDPSFSPLTSSSSSAGQDGDDSLQQQLLHLLSSWSSSSSLSSIIGVLLALYAQHNKERIAAAVTDERILFELSMLDELGCSEVLLTGGDGSPQQARLSLPVPADLAPAQQLLACIKKPQQTPQRPQQPQQQELQPEQEQQFMLTVSFPVAHGGGSNHIPVLQLHSPHWFTAQLPALSLPAWDPHTSLLEYVPHLAERVTKHLTDHCPTATNRFLLFEGLSGLLGPPLELNMMLMPTSSSSSFGSFPGPAGVRGRAATATGSTAGVWQVLFDQQPLLLFLELPRSYPADCPVLCLQNLRRTGSDSCVTLQNLPWSPRWPVDEQVARLFNFLKLHAAKASVVDTATAAGGVGVAPTPGGAGSSSVFPAAATAASVGDATQPGAAGGGSLPPGFYS